MIRERARSRRGNKDVDVVKWDQRQESINRRGKECLPVDKWNEWLRSLWTTERPESRAASPAKITAYGSTLMQAS